MAQGRIGGAAAALAALGDELTVRESEALRSGGMTASQADAVRAARSAVDSVRALAESLSACDGLPLAEAAELAARVLADRPSSAPGASGL